MYLVTGATGFIGKHLVGLLLARGKRVFALVREGSRERLKEIATARYGGRATSVIPVVGDITKPVCGLDAKTVKFLKASVEQIFHLAASYDLEADADETRQANVDGTRHAVQLANKLGVRLHYVSSIAVAGDYPGMFREDMFDEGQKHRHPYFLTKFQAEAVVRKEADIPYRIYRPGVVIGSSETGEADKIDGPYYSFKLIQRLRGVFPPWFPLIGLEGGRMPLVPVDYVAKAIDEIAHQEGHDGKAFHLVDPKPLSFGDAMNEFCKAAHAPQFTARIDQRVLDLIPSGALALVGNIPAVRSARRELLGDIGIPESALDYINWRTTFDSRDARAALRDAGIECPPLSAYAWRIWDFWERRMDPDLFRDRSLAGLLRGKVVMVTGASSGIGKALATRLGKAGAIVVLVARSADKLAETKSEIESDGGEAHVYPCDLTAETDCDKLVARALHEHGRVDILINNAGRSIRRSIAQSYDRFHDFQRTMAINYFGSVKLILGVLPSMRERRSGHIINVSSIGVQTRVPRFAAYVASKAALDTFSQTLATEVVGDRVSVTTVYMPLVRTPMIAPTKIYDSFPTISPDEAVDLILGSVLTRQKRVSTRLGTFSEVAYALAPKFMDRVLNVGYRLFPESAPDEKDKGKKKEQAPVSTEGVAFAYLLRGIHW